MSSASDLPTADQYDVLVVFAEIINVAVIINVTIKF